MATAYNPKIVTDGLVLCLDAANIKSYPGTGTTWTDLSGQGNNGTLTNGPTFNSNNGGSIVFDGTNDRVDSFNASSLTNMTIEMWIYDTRAITERDILTYNGNSGSYTFALTTFRTDGNGLSARSFTITQPSANQWYRFCYIKNSDLYINQTRYTGSGTDRTYGSFSFGNTRSDINNYLNGRISNVRVYNRNLTAAEIEQNFYALRGRYGI